jgi:hypothetical protein
VIVVPIGKQRINYFPIKSGRVIIPTHNFYLKAVRDLRFDNLPSGWSGSSTERFSKLGYYSYASSLSLLWSKKGILCPQSVILESSQ